MSLLVLVLAKSSISKAAISPILSLLYKSISTMSGKNSAKHLAESRQADLYAAVIITYIGALAAVALRFWSRSLQGAKYWLDDWLIVAAQVSNLATCL